MFAGLKQKKELGAERAPGSFLIYAEEAREKVGSFFSPCLQSRTSIRNLRSGLLLYEYLKGFFLFSFYTKFSAVSNGLNLLAKIALSIFFLHLCNQDLELSVSIKKHLHIKRNLFA